ncbi:hypothetical protein PGT21_024028 [Puccinia graminis f. sp. tritici]|uniref:Secreted protein n=1 Tax=Puccinia graminis f. sp. tritici TaxID=56615 RepID=A0A5B0NST8_PUCGR|nr:hypothetical protein PGT21_024028 [Puccinia graminis f. sp. tritici]KAA1092305.1 hypothetical protein PGTUg99_017282 [Puccinia graminis f. sp. tritici]
MYRSFLITCALLANFIILHPTSVEAIKRGPCEEVGGCDYYERMYKLDPGQAGRECGVQYHCWEMHDHTHTCRRTTESFSINTHCGHQINNRGRCRAPHQSLSPAVCPGANVDI